jgi:hypothetical protein
MMQIRCQRCGWNFTLGRDTIGLAVAEANQDRLEYYQFVCPNCRREVKVQVEVLRKHLPMDYVFPIPQPKPEPVAVHQDEPQPEPAAKVAPAVARPIGQGRAEKTADKKPLTKKSAEKKSTAKRPTAAKAAGKKPSKKTAMKSGK